MDSCKITMNIIIKSFSALLLINVVSGLNLNLETYPKEVLKGLENVELNFTLHLTSDNGLGKKEREVKIFFETDAAFFNFDEEQVVSKKKEDPYTIVLLDVEANQTINFNSSLIGIYKIRFYTEVDGIHGTKHYFEDNSTLRVAVGRDKAQLNAGINVVFTLILVIALFFMGLEIDIKLVYKVLKRPIGPTIGFVAQFGFMPICAYGLGELFLEQDFEKLGLLLLGSSPGGAPSNFWTAMFNGDINLSVTMTLLSSVASFAMTSLWVYVFGRNYSDKSIYIPYHMIALSLVSFVVPMGIGVLVKHKKPILGDRIQALFSRPFFLTCLVIMPIVGISNNIFFFYLVSWRHLVSGFLLGTLGYIFGAVLALICKQKRGQIIAISLETAIQNGAIAFVVLNLTFESPYSDMGVMPIISYFFCSTGPIMFVIYAIYQIYRCAVGKTTLDSIKQQMREIKRKAKGEPVNTSDEVDETNTELATKEELERMRSIEKETDIL